MNEQVTITLSRHDAWWLQSFCIDSAANWMMLGNQVRAGERSDLDASACDRLEERARSFATMLREAGADWI